MFALIFRGIFFMGVISWYSTSLWKMIDGYFKNQFQRYLEEEYQRNPKMREDVLLHAAVDRSENPLTDHSKQAELQELLEVCTIEAGCAVGEVESKPPRAFEAGAAVEHTKKEEEKEEAEKEVARPVDTDELAFRDSRTENDDSVPPDKKEENVTKILHNKGDSSLFEEPKQQQKEPAKSEKSKKHEQQNAGVRKKRRSRVRPPIGAKSKEEARRSSRQRVEALRLTEDDFDSATRRKRRFAGDERSAEEQRDFVEFEEDDNRENYRDEDDSVGIPLADLPFKPAINLYDMERLSEEEFCPLTLEEDPTCEETRSWP